MERSFERPKRKLYTYPYRIAQYGFMYCWNALLSLKPEWEPTKAGLKEINEIRKYGEAKTEFSDHLEPLFAEALVKKPKVIVELGVRRGESTFALERVAKLCGSKIIGVDIGMHQRKKVAKDWIFVQEDDLKFAKEWKKWCQKNKINPQIDLLYIDTSHFYWHTLEEIKSWFPHLSNDAKVIFHDSNLREIYFRKDGSVGLSYNERGVIQAVEKYLGAKFNERLDFIDYRKGWFIKQHANCDGLLIMEKLNL